MSTPSDCAERGRSIQQVARPTTRLSIGLQTQVLSASTSARDTGIPLARQLNCGKQVLDDGPGR